MTSEDPLKDGISSVELVSSMGDDLAVVNAARVSMNKHTDEFRERDERLIQFLARNGHWTPFAQVMLKFRIKAPIFVARQWFKHEVGFVRNEVSRRYVKDTPEIYVPNDWRMASADIKQGSLDQTHEHTENIAWLARTCAQTDVKLYESMLKDGVAPEQARMVLPQSMYTEWIETASLAAYARLYRERSQPDAQKEIREYALAMGRLVPSSMIYSWYANVYGG